MYLFVTLKIAFLLMIGYIGKPGLFKRVKKWILPAILYGIVQSFIRYSQYHGGLNPILVILLSVPTSVIFYMAMFELSALKTYVLSVVLIPFMLIPEPIFAIPVSLLSGVSKLHGRIDLNLIVFCYMPSYLILYFLRQQIRNVVLWFESCSEEFMLGLVVICLNTHWFAVAVNSTLLDFNTFSSEGEMLYIILMGTVIINVLPASLIYRSARKITQQSKSHNIVIAKGMLNDYLSQIHDLKNIAQVLNIMPTSYALKELSVVEKMIELKKSRAKRDNIIFYISNNPLSSHEVGPHTIHPFFNSLDCSIITGIFLDNAIEHVKANDHLERTIGLSWSPETHTFSVSNPITSEGAKFLQEHAKGKSSKKDTLLSGYGLANASELAKQCNVKIESQVVESVATFSLRYGA